MDEVAEAVGSIVAETGFSGAVRVDVDGGVAFAEAYGMARRDVRIANTVDTQFGLASGTKGLTALTVMRLVETGQLELATTARSLLGRDLPLIDDDVTVEQLLAHWSGIGDFMDEDAGLEITEYVLPVPVHELVTTEDYLRVLGGHPAKYSVGERFCYCNGGYVVLALLAERATGVPFADLVDEHVCQPAGMDDTAFLRSDELPGRAAVGYLSADGLRSNIFHLPVVGSGDGGIYSTMADVHALWAAFLGGRIVSAEHVAEMVRPRSDVPSEGKRYGLGFWLGQTGDEVMLEGYDAGVSFRTVHDPGRRLTHTVVANTAEGAWPIARRLLELFTASPHP